MILARMALVKIIIIIGNGNSVNNNDHRRIVMDCVQCIRGYIAIGILTLLSACGGGSDAPPSPPGTASTGVFVDGVVVGLHYETPTFSGTTYNAGEYDFLPGETVTFPIVWYRFMSDNNQIGSTINSPS